MRRKSKEEVDTVDGLRVCVCVSAKKKKNESKAGPLSGGESRRSVYEVCARARRVTKLNCSLSLLGGISQQYFRGLLQVLFWNEKKSVSRVFLLAMGYFDERSKGFSAEIQNC